MDNIIPFPKRIRPERSGLETRFRELYAKAGLSATQTESAIKELMPHIDGLIRDPYQAVFDIPESIDLTQEEVDALEESLAKCLQGAFADHSKTFEFALTAIAGIIGKHHLNNGAV